jgi:glutamyl-Q tRNA(Asp) synthetase
MRTRFAPSPTGPLHLGHAYAAILAHDMARGAGGAFLIRIEDIDRQRSKPEWEAAIFDDLAWLGLGWETPVMRQSDRGAVYGAALGQLWAQGVLYPCFCTRRDIESALGAPQEAAHDVPDGLVEGPDGPIYPGTCRPDRAAGTSPPPGAHLRVNMRTAAMTTRFTEEGQGPHNEHGAIGTTRADYIDSIGDIVVSRRDFRTSYHLSVVIDDAAQGITHVTRGRDLFEATRIHALLQCLLGLPTPVYHHHRLIRDEAGRRLAKRDDARSIRSYRDAGATPADIRRLVGLG